MTLASLLAIGFLLGLKHATDADHLVAVATLATRERSLAGTVRQGVFWGIGHTLTLMLFGGAVLLLGHALPPHLERLLEAAVGVMLIGLGIEVWYRVWERRIHFHSHRHGSVVHLHAHSHAGEDTHGRSPHDHAHAKPSWPLRALSIGVMHGLAGTAALVLLSLQSAPSLASGVAYIMVFGIGSILGMALLSAVIAVPLMRSARVLGGLHRGVTLAVGAASSLVGVWIVFEFARAGGW
jgi:cytochrome c biogenesis protein CcdA